MLFKVMEATNGIERFEMLMMLAQCISSKNRLSRKHGHLPQQAVTGYDLPVPESVIDHPEHLAVHQLMTEDAILQYRDKCRNAAAFVRA